MVFRTEILAAAAVLFSVSGVEGFVGSVGGMGVGLRTSGALVSARPFASGERESISSTSALWDDAIARMRRLRWRRTTSVPFSAPLAGKSLHRGSSPQHSRHQRACHACHNTTPPFHPAAWMG